MDSDKVVHCQEAVVQTLKKKATYLRKKEYCASEIALKKKKYKAHAIPKQTVGTKMVYKMDAETKGICVIINDRNFTNERLSRRDGTDEDKNKVEDFFRRRHFEVRIFENQTDSDMLEELKRISSLDHRSYDCFVCFILSHGQHGSVCGSNGQLEYLGKIQTLFCAKQCPSLANKPKIFFVQVCQGGWPDDVRVDYPVYEGPDFLTVFDTTPDFISTLIEELDRKTRDSLVDIITMVTNKMDEVTEPKQIPMFSSTLKKQIILN